MKNIKSKLNYFLERYEQGNARTSTCEQPIIREHLVYVGKLQYDDINLVKTIQRNEKYRPPGVKPQKAIPVL